MCVVSSTLFAAPKLYRWLIRRHYMHMHRAKRNVTRYAFTFLIPTHPLCVFASVVYALANAQRWTRAMMQRYCDATHVRSFRGCSHVSRRARAIRA